MLLIESLWRRLWFFTRAGRLFFPTFFSVRRKSLRIKSILFIFEPFGSDNSPTALRNSLNFCVYEREKEGRRFDDSPGWKFRCPDWSLGWLFPRVSYELKPHWQDLDIWEREICLWVCCRLGFCCVWLTWGNVLVLLPQYLWSFDVGFSFWLGFWFCFSRRRPILWVQIGAATEVDGESAMPILMVMIGLLICKFLTVRWWFKLDENIKDDFASILRFLVDQWLHRVRAHWVQSEGSLFIPPVSWFPSGINVRYFLPNECKFWVVKWCWVILRFFIICLPIGYSLFLSGAWVQLPVPDGFATVNAGRTGTFTFINDRTRSPARCWPTDCSSATTAHLLFKRSLKLRFFLKFEGITSVIIFTTRVDL